VPDLTASLLNINEAQLTIDILDRLARLSEEDWAIQLIFVDNGSRDDQLQQLFDWFKAKKDHFAEILFVASSRNLGANGGRNLAYNLAAYALGGWTRYGRGWTMTLKSASSGRCSCLRTFQT
jgi:GT2 family glycosyltransferase